MPATRKLARQERTRRWLHEQLDVLRLTVRLLQGPLEGWEHANLLIALMQRLGKIQRIKVLRYTGNLGLLETKVLVEVLDGSRTLTQRGDGSFLISPLQEVEGTA